MASTGTFDVEAARAQFPALQQEQVFMDNAGRILYPALASAGVLVLYTWK